MQLEYGLPIYSGMLELLKSWNWMDPPSQAEVRRNYVIDSLQGTRNPFIDHPEAAEFYPFWTLPLSRRPESPEDATLRTVQTVVEK